MTCIAGVAQGSGVWLAADSAGVAGQRLTVRDDSKLMLKRVKSSTPGTPTFGFPLVIGYTSSFRMGQLLRHTFTAPEFPYRGHPGTYLESIFAEEVRACLKRGGYSHVENNNERGGQFLIGFYGHVYVMESDFALETPADPFIAVGSGEEIAMGALYATKRSAKPLPRLKTALSASERFTASVRAPFRWLTADRYGNVDEGVL